MHFFPLLCAAVAIQGAKVPPQHLPKAPASSKVVAKVNGKEIRAADVEAILWDWRGQEVLQDLVSYVLITEEAHREKIHISEAEVLKLVDDQLGDIKSNLRNGRDLEGELRARGYPQSRLYMKVKTDLIIERLAEKWFRPSDYVYVSTIAYVPASATATDVANAFSLAQETYDRLQNGEKWENLRGSQVRSLWTRISDFPLPTRTEVAVAAPGTVTKPAHNFGEVTLFRIEKVGARASASDLEDLKEFYQLNARQYVLRRIRDKAKIQIMDLGSKALPQRR